MQKQSSSHKKISQFLLYLQDLDQHYKYISHTDYNPRIRIQVCKKLIKIFIKDKNLTHININLNIYNDSVIDLAKFINIRHSNSDNVSFSNSIRNQLEFFTGHYVLIKNLHELYPDSFSFQQIQENNIEQFLNQFNTILGKEIITHMNYFNLQNLVPIKNDRPLLKKIKI